MLSFFTGISRLASIDPGVIRMSCGGTKEIVSDYEAYPEGGMRYGGGLVAASHSVEAAGGLGFGGSARPDPPPYDFTVWVLDADGNTVTRYRLAKAAV